MEALSSFGFTESAKFEVPDTDVLQAKIAVQEVKNELQNFTGEVGDVKTAIGKKGDTADDTFFGALAKAVGLGGSGGGSSTTVTPPDVKEEREKARNGAMIIEIADDSGDPDTEPYIIFLRNKEDMMKQINELAKIKNGEGHNAPVIRDLYFYGAKEAKKSDAPKFMKFLQDAVKTINRGAGEAPTIKDYENVTDLFIKDGVTNTDGSQINFEKVIDDYLGKASEDEQNMIASINAVINIDDGGRKKKKGPSDRSSQVATEIGEIVKVGAEEGKVTNKARNDPFIRKYIDVNLSDLKNLPRIIYAWKFTLSLLLYILIFVRNPSLVQEAKDLANLSAIISTPSKSNIMTGAYNMALEDIQKIPTALTDFEFQNINARAIAEIPVIFFMMLKENPSKREEYMNSAIEMFEILSNDLSTMTNESIKKIGDKLKLIKKNIPDTFKINISSEASREREEAERRAGGGWFSGLFSNFAGKNDNKKDLAKIVDNKEDLAKVAKHLLMMDQFLQKIACDTQMPGMIVLLSTLRENYAKLLEGAIPIDKKRSVYTAIEVGKKTHKVYFHGGCAKLEDVSNFVNMMGEVKEEGDDIPELTESAKPVAKPAAKPAANTVKTEEKALKNLIKIQAGGANGKASKCKASGPEADALTNYLDYSSLV